MTCSVVIVGLPSAPTCPPEKTWAAAAGFVAKRLRERFGDEVDVAYADLFSPAMLARPEIEQMVVGRALELPLVVVDGAVLSAGGKLNVSAIERGVAAALAPEAGKQGSMPHA